MHMLNTSDQRQPIMQMKISLLGLYFERVERIIPEKMQDSLWLCVHVL